MCQRSIEVIPGLLKRLARYDEVVHCLDNRMDMVEKRHSGWQADVVVVDHDTIRSAVAVVKVIFGTKLSFDIGQARLNHLKERHEMFSWLFNRPGVRWIPRPNIVLVNESLWEDIGRVRKALGSSVPVRHRAGMEELKIIFGVPENEPYHPSDGEVYPETRNLLGEIEVRMPPGGNENSEGESTVDKA
ncbi:hypothetical protein Salat_2113300 [Sesamum alatum]|uniref:Uncharacterized protein n=1 Tax=Sesamum alatum TaxID=300844 RepID=A0AAE1Y175_9LAMI|nr:hypothetical protein Salat_2113300 [Sesamum alatum]